MPSQFGSAGAAGTRVAEDVGAGEAATGDAQGAGRQAQVLRAFASTSDVMEAARACRDAGIACRLMPRPAFIEGAGCGTVLRSSASDEAEVSGLLSSAGLVPVARAEAPMPL